MTQQNSWALVPHAEAGQRQLEGLNSMSLAEVEAVKAGSPWATIAVMGVTGAGKSTFIQTVSGDSTVVVGDSLKSCTSDLRGYSFHHDGFNINLIDTPGFNDTFRSETEVLQDISSWLRDSYEEDNKLAGIVYLHGINHSRVEGSALRNLKMFRELCGPEPLQNVLLATTFWNDVQPRIGAERERELAGEHAFWGGMLRRGSRMARVTDRDSGLDILSDLLGGTPQALKIQREMVDDSKPLVNTGAGQVVNEELTRVSEQHRKELDQMRADMQEAILAKDAELQEVLKDQSERLESELDRVHRQQEQLRADRRAETRRMQSDFQEAMSALGKQKDMEVGTLRDDIEELQGDLQRRRHEHQRQDAHLQRLLQSHEAASKTHEQSLRELHQYSEQTLEMQQARIGLQEQRIAELQRYNEDAQRRFGGLDIDSIIAKVRAEESRLRPDEREKLEAGIQDFAKQEAKGSKRALIVNIFFGVLRTALSVASLVTLGIPLSMPN